MIPKQMKSGEGLERIVRKITVTTISGHAIRQQKQGKEMFLMRSARGGLSIKGSDEQRGHLSS